MLEDIREKKTNRITYLLVIIAGIGMLFIGVPYFNHSGDINVATVNGQEIPMRAYQDQYRDIQQQQPNLSEADLKQRAVRSLIERTLFQQQALNSRYRLPDSALYRIIKEQFGNDENYQQWLKARGISAETYQQSVRSEQSIAGYYSTLQAAGGENNPLYKHYLQSAAQERGYTLYTIPRAPIAAAINVDDGALQKHYEAHGERYATPETVDINYTIYDIADLPVSDEQIAKARAASERRGGRYLIIDDAKAASDAAAAIKDGRKTFADYWQAVTDKTTAGETGTLDPADEAMLARLRAMADAGADIAKLAVTPRGPRDVARLLGVTARAGEELDVAVATMSMGPLGAVSRLSGAVFGSALTFATAGGAPSAPGQLPIDRVRAVLDILPLLPRNRP